MLGQRRAEEGARLEYRHIGTVFAQNDRFALPLPLWQRFATVEVGNASRPIAWSGGIIQFVNKMHNVHCEFFDATELLEIAYGESSRWGKFFWRCMNTPAPALDCGKECSVNHPHGHAAV